MMHRDATTVILHGSIASLDQVHDELANLWHKNPWITPDDRMAVEAALIELVTNVIRYALRDESDDAELTLTVVAAELSAEVTDHGLEFFGDLTTLSMPGPDAESGRGLAVIDALMDDFQYSRVSGRSRWTIVRRLTAPAAGS